jgi:hypothetical protein
LCFTLFGTAAACAATTEKDLKTGRKGVESLRRLNMALLSLKQNIAKQSPNNADWSTTQWRGLIIVAGHLVLCMNVSIARDCIANAHFRNLKCTVNETAGVDLQSPPAQRQTRFTFLTHVKLTIYTT